jgi:serine/threonine-protein kinase PknG
MTACARPDCSGGRLGEDGVCDLCFRGPAAVVVGVGARCVRPDCPGGNLDADGICGGCFRAPGAPDPAPPRLDPRPWYHVPWEGGPPRDAAGPLAFPAPGGASRHVPGGSELGIGIVDIPPVAPRTPEEALRGDAAELDEDGRCPNPACRRPIQGGAAAAPAGPGYESSGLPGAGTVAAGPGDAAAPAPAPARGFCPHCGTAFSLRPPLRAGETIGQYRIRGCVGRGGQGWVYLAGDLNLDEDPVALKGLRDAAFQEVLAAERSTLIAVRHRDIVDIRNFVQRRDPDTGRLDGFIVLEFLDGLSLEDKALRAGGILPVAEALSYILATLPALGYLHDSGLVYGDFKPPNVMQVGDRVKLVDLGAVSPIGRPAHGRTWVTPGFAAPEILRRQGPGVASDVYSVGRTLASLTMRFAMADAQGASLPMPDPDTEPVFARYESYYRLLRRATAEDPGARFGSAAQFAEQLTGVLREVVALDDDRPRPTPSALFTLERGGPDTDLRTPVDPVATALALPAPRPDDADPAAGFLHTVTSTEPDELVRLLGAAPRRTVEVGLRLVAAHLARREFDAADAALGEAAGAAGADPHDWRLLWYQGLISLARGAAEPAWHAFAAIRDALPGEPAPKLALAACAESLRAHELARHYYRTVWRTDDTFVGAAFGVARSYVTDPAHKTDEHPVNVLEAIPNRLHHHVAARVEALRLRLDRPDLNLDGLREAARRFRELQLEEKQRLLLEVRLWEAARALVGRAGAAESEQLLDVPLTGDKIGRRLERTHLALRRYSATRRERVEQVRAAHAARPRTRW